MSSVIYGWIGFFLISAAERNKGAGSIVIALMNSGGKYIYERAELKPNRVSRRIFWWRLRGRWLLCGRAMHQRYCNKMLAPIQNKTKGTWAVRRPTRNSKKEKNIKGWSSACYPPTTEPEGHTSLGFHLVTFGSTAFSLRCIPSDATATHLLIYER